MGRHQTQVAPGARAARLVGLGAIWLAGLGAGLFGLLSIAAKFSCARTAQGLACRPAGTAVGVALVAAVVVIVTTVTTLGNERCRPRTLVVLLVAAVAALALCYWGAHALIATA